MKYWIITIASILVICLLLGFLCYAEFGSFNFIRVGLALTKTPGGDGVYQIADRPERAWLAGTRGGLEAFRTYLEGEGYVLRMDEQMGAQIPAEKDGHWDYVYWSSNAMYHKFVWKTAGDPAREPAATEPVALYSPEAAAGSAYFYPEMDTRITIRAKDTLAPGCVYPFWTDLIAHPGGTLAGRNGTEYRRLYWEGEEASSFPMSEGFCVAGYETGDFLEEALGKLGLTAEEREDFIVHCLPRMYGNRWNLISFREYTALEVSPAPETAIGILMLWEALESPVEIEPQTLTARPRTGFTVIQWICGEVG